MRKGPAERSRIDDRLATLDDRGDVTIRTGQNDSRRLVLQVEFAAQSGSKRRTSPRLDDQLQSLESVAYGGFQIVVAYGNRSRQVIPRESERNLARHRRHQGIGNGRGPAGSLGPFTRCHRPAHAVKSLRLDGKDLGLGTRLRKREGNAAHEAAAAAWYQDCIENNSQSLGVGSQLHSDGALSRDNRRVVERLDERCPGALDDFSRNRLAVVAVAIVEDNIGAKLTRAGDLWRRRILGHDDCRGYFKQRRRGRDAL